MTDHLDNLANKIMAPRHRGQLPGIRILFDMYLRDQDAKRHEDPPAVVYLSVGFIFAGIVLAAVLGLG